jgi:hypothetical protein
MNYVNGRTSIEDREKWRIKKRKRGVENEGNYEGTKIWEKQKELKMGVT